MILELTPIVKSKLEAGEYNARDLLYLLEAYAGWGSDHSIVDSVVQKLENMKLETNKEFM